MRLTFSKGPLIFIAKSKLSRSSVKLGVAAHIFRKELKQSVYDARIQALRLSAGALRKTDNGSQVHRRIIVR
jgi:hypothetical protein